MTETEVIIALVVGMAVLLLVGGVAGYLQLRQIHAAVNSNMTTALNKIEDLHGRVAELVLEARHKAQDENEEREAT